MISGVMAPVMAGYSSVAHLSTQLISWKHSRTSIEFGCFLPQTPALNIVRSLWLLLGRFNPGISTLLCPPDRSLMVGILIVCSLSSLLFACHMTNAAAQTVQTSRFVNYWYMGGQFPGPISPTVHLFFLVLTNSPAITLSNRILFLFFLSFVERDQGVKRSWSSSPNPPS